MECGDESGLGTPLKGRVRKAVQRPESVRFFSYFLTAELVKYSIREGRELNFVFAIEFDHNRFEATFRPTIDFDNPSTSGGGEIDAGRLLIGEQYVTHFYRIAHTYIHKRLHADIIVSDERHSLHGWARAHLLAWCTIDREI